MPAEVLDRLGAPVPLAAVTAAFGLPSADAERVPGGKNEHYLLRTDAGVAYLRRSHRHKDVGELAAQVGWSDRLRTAGLPTPEHLLTADGSPVLVHEGRFWTASWALPGSTPSPGDPSLPALLGATAARTALLAAQLPHPAGLPVARSLREEVRDRLAACPASDLPPAVRDVADRVLDDLDRWEAELPRSVVHGGARRASLRVEAGRVVGVLDFDSARHDARLLDLATAVHDTGKSAEDGGDRRTRIGLALDRVEQIARAHGAVLPLTSAESACLPAVLLARRLNRLLGRLARAAAGVPASDNDRAKVVQEQQRLAWLDAHRDGLAAALSPASGARAPLLAPG